MTKDEYEQLLKSDYWKGYSYSLIKERNFTCEDCGRSYPNERNKLQVHHLAYRDVNPWSYKPDEVIVLCEDCHKKRHGIATEPFREEKQPIYQEQDKTYSTPNYSSGTFRSGDKYDRGIKPDRKDWKRFVFPLCGVLILLYLNYWPESESKVKEPELSVVEEVVTPPVAEPQEQTAPIAEPQLQACPVKKEGNVEKATPTTQKAEPVQKAIEQSKSHDQAEEASVIPFNPATEEKTIEPIDVTPSSQKSTMELLEERTHANVVKQAQQAGVSTEGSTSDILERITHANVVKQAQQAGVSTEGSTSDILERITHANVVKQAQQAGVSTEGSTSDILERITHANVVKQAKQVGVSTEGSTSDILERITRKNMEKYNK